MTNSRIGTHTRNILARGKVNYSSLKAANLERVTEYYTHQIDKRIDLMKRQYSGGKMLDINTVPTDDIVLNSAMYYAIDFVVSASEFGGTAFYGDKDALPRQVMTLIKFAAQQPGIIFSPAEYDAVRHGLSRYMDYPGVVDSYRVKLQKIDSDLKARYNHFSQDITYKNLFLVNEGK